MVTVATGVYHCVCVVVFFNSLFLRQVCTQTSHGQLTCPATWTDGHTHVITCTIRVSSYNNATCNRQFSDIVDLQFFNTSNSPSSQCKVHSLHQACNGNYTNEGCRCRGISGESYVLEFAVTVSRDRHDGGTWKCVPGCEDASFRNPFLHPPHDVSLRCGPVNFGHSNTPASTTVEVTSAPNPPGVTSPMAPAVQATESSYSCYQCIENGVSSLGAAYVTFYVTCLLLFSRMAQMLH
ncbi:uncharacterized protein [Littorina saxatilis]|uniref:uncharacterized protein n=1 Tax=Littorina saxatilis TaxID=31220 RepID=UPI0038B6907B